MTADYITEQQAQECEELKQAGLMREAAIHVINGMTRHDAKAFVYEIDNLRDDADRRDQVVRDEDGYIESYLNSELEAPSAKGLKESQIKAITKELCESEGILAQ